MNKIATSNQKMRRERERDRVRKVKQFFAWKDFVGIIEGWKIENDDIQMMMIKSVKIREIERGVL